MVLERCMVLDRCTCVVVEAKVSHSTLHGIELALAQNVCVCVNVSDCELARKCCAHMPMCPYSCAHHSGSHKLKPITCNAGSTNGDQRRLSDHHEQQTVISKPTCRENRHKQQTEISKPTRCPRRQTNRKLHGILHARSRPPGSQNR